MIKASYNFIDSEIPGFNPEFFDLWLSKIFEAYDKKYSNLTFVFCSDEYLLEVNKKYLEHDYYTDIITFNYNEKYSVIGDVFISVDRVKENAIKYEEGDFGKELKRVIAHGVLHLFGFKDKTEKDKKTMRKEEDWCLEINVSRETFR